MMDELLQVFAQTEPLLPCVYAVVIATAVLMIPLSILGGRTWVNQAGFGWLSVFYDMRVADVARLSCAWIRMVIVIVMLAMVTPLVLAQYLLFIFCVIVHMLLSIRFVDFLNMAFWAMLQMMGLVSTSLICGYMQLIIVPNTFWFLYGLLCVFMGVFSLYLFLMEVNTVSLRRSANIGKQSTNTGDQ